MADSNSFTSHFVELRSRLLNSLIFILIAFIISLHLGLIFFGLFHAVWGQYFYFPFLVENTELHIGPRPKASIYSGGFTAWQDQKDKNVQRVFPKLWYGWFGNGKTTNWGFLKPIKTLGTNIIRKLKKQFLR